MKDDLELVARLRAYESGRAVRFASHLHLALRPDALLFCPLSMAGEDTTIHCIALGTVGTRPRLLWVPDPRYRDDQYRLFTQLAEIIEPYFQRCFAQHTFPQLWVSSGAAAKLIDVLADRLRFNQQNMRVKQLGELLTYLSLRYGFKGQQSLLVATEALRLHWKTGQQDGEDEHLAALLTWFKPPAGLSIHQAVALTELIPSGVKTDPGFDRDILAPLVQQYNRARKRHAPAAELHQRSTLIRDALAPVAQKIYRNTRRAYLLLQQSGLPPLPSLPQFAQREAQEFASFMQSRGQGHHLPLRDSVRSAAHGLVAREDAEALVSAVLLREDAVERARGRTSGYLLEGSVIQSQRQRLRPYIFQYSAQLRSTQQVLRVRPRDTFVWADDPRLQVEVTAVQRVQGATFITVRLTEGMRSVGLPAPGAVLDLMPSRPDWDRLTRERMHLKTRLQQTPWTHRAGDAPHHTASAVLAPPDPLALVEALR
jgi:hypothetical protein